MSSQSICHMSTGAFALLQFVDTLIFLSSLWRRIPFVHSQSRRHFKRENSLDLIFRTQNLLHDQRYRIVLYNITSFPLRPFLNLQIFD